MSIFGGLFGGSQTQTQTTTVDPATQAYLDRYRQMASEQANNLTNQRPLSASYNPYVGGANTAFHQGLSPYLTGAAQGYGGLFNMGFQNGGLNTAAFMNPFEQNVVAGTQADYQRQRDLAAQQANQQATQAGAFGGSRGAVLQANALNDINRNEASQLANLRYGGFTNAQNMASQLGLAGLGGLTGIGQYAGNLGLQQGQGLLGLAGLQNQINVQNQYDPLVRAQAASGLMGNAIGPYGTTTTNQQQSHPGLFSTLLGAGLTFGGLGGFGALGGLFGGGGNSDGANIAGQGYQYGV